MLNFDVDFMDCNQVVLIMTQANPLSSIAPKILSQIPRPLHNGEMKIIRQNCEIIRKPLNSVSALSSCEKDYALLRQPTKNKAEID